MSNRDADLQILPSEPQTSVVTTVSGYWLALWTAKHERWITWRVAKSFVFVFDKHTYACRIGQVEGTQLL